MLGCTEIVIGPVLVAMIGSKSLIASYVIFFINVGLIACVEAVPISSV